MSGHLQYVLSAIINKVLHHCHTMNKMNNVLFHPSILVVYFPSFLCRIDLKSIFSSANSCCCYQRKTTFAQKSIFFNIGAIVLG